MNFKAIEAINDFLDNGESSDAERRVYGNISSSQSHHFRCVRHPGFGENRLCKSSTSGGVILRAIHTISESKISPAQPHLGFMRSYELVQAKRPKFCEPRMPLAISS